MPLSTTPSQTLSIGQMFTLIRKAGADPATAVTLTAVGYAESTGRVNAVNHNANGSTDYGLWQINSIHGYNAQQLLTNPQYNANAAYAIWKSEGFGAWTKYKTGDYAQFQAQALQAAATGGTPVTPSLLSEIQHEGAKATGLDAAQGAIHNIKDAFDAAKSTAISLERIAATIGHAAGWISNPRNWLRIALAIIGGALVIGGAITIGARSDSARQAAQLAGAAAKGAMA